MPSNYSNGNSSLEIAHSNQDLIITKGKRKKRACIIGAVVGVVVVALVVTLVVLLTRRSNESETVNAIDLEDVLDGTFTPKTFNATWISDEVLLYRNSDGSLMKYNVKEQSHEELLPNTTSALRTCFEYQLSPDSEYLLMAHDYQKLYRHTYLARYTILNLNTHQEVPLHDAGVLLHYATWSPTGNSIAYVWRNNIYYKSLAFDERFVQITTDGLEGHLYNGIPDWVYEEEVFGSNRAMWFSPNGKKLAYIKFDDNSTSIMTIPYYGIPGSLDSQYTKLVQIRYPKPGTRNPDVSLHVFDIDTAQTIDLPVPSDLSEEIISEVAWATDNVVSPIWLNRVQNEAYIVAYDTSSYARAIDYQIVQHIKQENGWLDLFTEPIFSKDGSQMLLILSQDQGDNDGSYRHITRFNVEVNAQSVAITKGKFVVTEILGWDETRNFIYYLANIESDPAVQHVYSISTTTNTVNCLSCNVRTNLKQEECLYNSARFSKDFSYYVFNCAGPGIPELSVFSSETLERLSIWEDNHVLVNNLGETKLPRVQRLVFEVADNFTALVSLKLPPNIDLSGNTKYPMVVNVYGGPDSYQVIEKFTLDWGTYLANNKSIIYATIDGRGSGLKGDKILFSGYRHLGTVEIEDQINVTKQIQQTVPYVDGTRTAIWGWSYGGYASGLALATDKENVFKCGMSVAPVTDWTLYDSIYTERFMGLPTEEDNVKGYDDAKLLNYYNGIRNKEYYLIHGTFDDNVHYQQSMLWSKLLEHQDIMFRQQSYPDEDHGLGAVRHHLYHSLENFLDTCFIENV